MVSKNLSGIKDLTGLALPILVLPTLNTKVRILTRLMRFVSQQHPTFFT